MLQGNALNVALIWLGGEKKMKIALHQDQAFSSETQARRDNPEHSRRIAVSSAGKSLESKVAGVFGRCPYFIIADIENNQIVSHETMENAAANQMGGAGISAAQAVVEKNVDAVIAGNIGPRALDVLRQFNIKIYNGSGLVKDVLQKFIQDKLEKIE